MSMRLATHRYSLNMPSLVGIFSYDKLGGVPTRSLTKHSLSNVARIHITVGARWIDGDWKRFIEGWEVLRGPNPFPNLESLTITANWGHWFP